MKLLLTLIGIFCFFVSKSQQDAKETVVTMQLEARLLNRPVFNKTDTFLVRTNFVLEPIKTVYLNEETNLSTGVSKRIASGKRLQSYNLTNYREMIGMSFDIDKKPSAKTIETYNVSTGNKPGIRFINEPYLSNGFTVSDFTKDKDTVIDGKKYLLIKNNKVITTKANNGASEKILEVRIAINPSFKSYDFPFISEKIVQQFGGGAIVYIAYITESCYNTTVRYNYSPFTPAETSLFDRYQAIYNANLALFDKLK